MKKANKPRGGAGRYRLSNLALAAAGALLGLPSAHAVEIDTGNPDLKVLWDSTVKYSSAWRPKEASAKLTVGQANNDDGDRNFRKGLISNRLDLLSEFDIAYKGFGARLSGAAWYDGVYNHGNDNNSPGTVNPYSVPFNQFSADTRDLHGRKAEMLDAFVFGKIDLGEAKASFRAGKHSVLWGESLFFGSNGIAGVQASVDVVKALSVPNTQFKELIRPSNQLSGQLQLNQDVAIGAYYKLHWDAQRLPGVGSYFSDTDFLPTGAERVNAGPPGGENGVAFFHGGDITARNRGQGGLQVKFHVDAVDFGVYAVRYHDNAPQLYLRPAAKPTPTANGLDIGQFVWVYPEGITAYAMSATTTVGPVNYAVEIGTRRNVALSSSAGIDATGTANNNSNPLYAVGNSAHVNLSWLASIGQSFISREADLTGEIAWNRRLSVTRNPGALETVTTQGTSGVTRDAAAMRMIYEPKYRQVFDGVDLSVPVGIGYSVYGNSSVTVFKRKGVGDFSTGLSGSYLDAWRFGVNYTHYFGTEGTSKYDQTLADRDFVSFRMQRTF